MTTESVLEKVMKAGHVGVTGECGPPRGCMPDKVKEKAELLRGMAVHHDITRWTAHRRGYDGELIDPCDGRGDLRPALRRRPQVQGRRHAPLLGAVTALGGLTAVIVHIVDLFRRVDDPQVDEAAMFAIGRHGGASVAGKSLGLVRRSGSMTPRQKVVREERDRRLGRPLRGIRRAVTRRALRLWMWPIMCHLSSGKRILFGASS